MYNITTYKELQNRIELLEVQTRNQEIELRDRIRNTYESLKPQNLIRNAFTDATSTPEVRNNILNTTVGLLTGILTNKLLIGSSAGVVKKMAGTALQFGITKFIANNFPAIRHKAQELFQKRKEKNHNADHNGTLHR